MNHEEFMRPGPSPRSSRDQGARERAERLGLSNLAKARRAYQILCVISRIDNVISALGSSAPTTVRGRIITYRFPAYTIIGWP